MIRTTLGVAIVCALTGCANLAPDFLRPAAPIPTEWPESLL